MIGAKACCRDCRFVEILTAGTTRMTCHRFPPRGESNFPIVYGQDWCGEFQRKAAEGAVGVSNREDLR